MLENRSLDQAGVLADRGNKSLSGRAFEDPATIQPRRPAARPRSSRSIVAAACYLMLGADPGEGYHHQLPAVPDRRSVSWVPNNRAGRLQGGDRSRPARGGTRFIMRKRTSWACTMPAMLSHRARPRLPPCVTGLLGRPDLAQSRPRCGDLLCPRRLCEVSSPHQHLGGCRRTTSTGVFGYNREPMTRMDSRHAAPIAPLCHFAIRTRI